MGIMQEFKAFAIEGNAVDMAVGIIIGASFGKVVSSFVEDVLMPPIGFLLGGVDFSDLAVVLKEASGDIPAVSISYGIFIQSVIDFTIVAFAIFMVVKGINSLKKNANSEEDSQTSAEEVLLTEIRDLLKEKKRDDV